MLLFVGTRSLGTPVSHEDRAQYIPLKSIVRDNNTPEKAYGLKVSTFDIEEPQKQIKKTVLQTFLGLFCCCNKKR